MSVSQFLGAIKSKNLITITFKSQSKGTITRICAPLDFGKHSRAKDNLDRFHMLDINSPDGAHVLSVLPNTVISMTVMKEKFDPAKVISWSPVSWWYPRDTWGEFNGTRKVVK